MSYILPTKKPHVSFSEIKEWAECPFRHKLKYVDGLDLSEPSPILDFGIAVHEACENYLKTKVTDLSLVKKILDESWEKNAGKPGFAPDEKDKLIEVAAQILVDIPDFMDKTFPNWKYVAAEELLYENIGESDIKFKGMIDGVIMVPTMIRKKEKMIYWIIDWKTSAWGWSPQKKADPMVQSQIILYKHFWSNKFKVDPKEIKCGFVILKKSGKIGNHCELIPISVGPVATERSLKVLSNAISGIKKGLTLKNRNSCKFCDFYQTEHCT